LLNAPELAKAIPNFMFTLPRKLVACNS
jgi:hypothetical protein